MEHPIKMDDLGGKKPYFWFNTHMYPTLRISWDPPKKRGLDV